MRADRVVVNPVAVGARECRSCVFTATGNTGALPFTCVQTTRVETRVPRRERWTRQNRARADRWRIDPVKVDVEGAEALVFRVPAACWRRTRPPIVFFELNDALCSACQVTRAT